MRLRINLVFALLVSICTFVVAPHARAQTVRYVDAEANGPTHDGSDWCSAFTDLQNALAIATSGDTIRVANGTYNPDRGTGDRTASFEMVNGVEIVGGYAGCGAPLPEERDVELYETILSGDLNGNDDVIVPSPGGGTP